jgi:glycosyltransferase involved in cell wall biosynthesis
MLIEKGIKKPIHIIYPGLDNLRYNDKANTINIDVAINQFVFLTTLKSVQDYEYNVLLKSYLEEFSSQDNVTLLALAKHIDKNNVEKFSNDFQQIRATVNKTDEELPQIVLYDKPIPEKQMPGLYALANTFIRLSSSESFGLSYIESAAVETPIITTNIGGQTDYLNDRNCYMIDVDKDVEKQSMFYMRYVFNNNMEAENKSGLLGNVIRNKFTWNNTISNIYSRIEELKHKMKKGA